MRGVYVFHGALETSSLRFFSFQMSDADSFMLQILEIHD